MNLSNNGAKLSEFLDSKMQDGSFTTNDLVQFIEQVGFYNPNLATPELAFDQEKVMKWLGVGAQPSDTVASLLRKQGIYRCWKKSLKKCWNRKDCAGLPA